MGFMNDKFGNCLPTRRATFPVLMEVGRHVGGGSPNSTGDESCGPDVLSDIWCLGSMTGNSWRKMEQVNNCSNENSWYLPGDSESSQCWSICVGALQSDSLLCMHFLLRKPLNRFPIHLGKQAILQIGPKKKKKNPSPKKSNLKPCNSVQTAHCVACLSAWVLWTVRSRSSGSQRNACSWLVGSNKQSAIAAQTLTFLQLWVNYQSHQAKTAQCFLDENYCSERCPSEWRCGEGHKIERHHPAVEIWDMGQCNAEYDSTDSHVGQIDTFTLSVAICTWPWENMGQKRNIGSKYTGNVSISALSCSFDFACDIVLWIAMHRRGGPVCAGTVHWLRIASQSFQAQSWSGWWPWFEGGMCGNFRSKDEYLMGFRDSFVLGVFPTD